MNSFDVPEREVEKEASNNSSAILSISTIPSPMVFPGTGAAETVADTYLLYLNNCGGLDSSLMSTRLLKGINSPLLLRTLISCKSLGSFRNSLWACPITSYCFPSFIKYPRSEEHTSELQSRPHLVCRLL